MRFYLVSRHVISTVAVALLLPAPLLMAGQPLTIPKILFWSALASALYLYHRIRRLGFLPAYDNLNISVLRVLGVSFVGFQLVGLAWVLLRW